MKTRPMICLCAATVALLFPGCAKESGLFRPEAYEVVYAEPAGEPTDPSPLDQMPWTADVTRVTRPASGADEVLHAVRVGRHQGFDRLVFEFKEGRIPGHHIEYVDQPVRECGSGRPVEVPGDARLMVRLLSTQAHTEGGENTVGDRERQYNLRVIRELELICDAEGVVEWVLGVSGPNGYRAFELNAPSRLVVDLRH